MVSALVFLILIILTIQESMATTILSRVSLMVGISRVFWGAFAWTLHSQRDKTRKTRIAELVILDAVLMLSKKPPAHGLSPICDPAVSYLINKETGREIWLVGTAHISVTSAKLVKEIIQLVHPQAVMVELDDKRLSRALGSKGTSVGMNQMDVKGIIIPKLESGEKQLREEEGSTWLSDKVAGVGGMVLKWRVGGLYRYLDSLGFVSGLEFLVAIHEARAIQADIVLGDRDIEVTSRRLWRALIKSSKRIMKRVVSKDRQPGDMDEQDFKNLTSLLEGLKDAHGGLDIKELLVFMEGLKDRGRLRELVGLVRGLVPDICQAMVDERDQYMARVVGESRSKSMVAVVGMGHMDGMEAYLVSHYGFQIDETRGGVCCPKS